MNRLHQHRGDVPFEESPMGPTAALAHAFAAADGRGAYRADDMADAARAMIDLRDAGVLIEPGAARVTGQLIASLAAAAARARYKLRLSDPAAPKPAPRDEATAERIAAELAQLGFGLRDTGDA